MLNNNEKINCDTFHYVFVYKHFGTISNCRKLKITIHMIIVIEYGYSNQKNYADDYLFLLNTDVINFAVRRILSD